MHRKTTNLLEMFINASLDSVYLYGFSLGAVGLKSVSYSQWHHNTHNSTYQNRSQHAEDTNSHTYT